MVETDNQIRLRREGEAIEKYREEEAQTLRHLASIRDSLKIARERYDRLFASEEEAEVSRRMNDYQHGTK